MEQADLDRLAVGTAVADLSAKMLAERPLTFQEVKVLANAGLEQSYQRHLGRSVTFDERKEWWTRQRSGMDPYYLSAFEPEHREMIIRASTEEVPRA